VVEGFQCVNSKEKLKLKVKLAVRLSVCCAAVRVSASGDVTVYVVSVTDWSTGSYVALPLDELGSDYYVLSATPANERRALSHVVIVSAADNTVVRLSLEAKSSTLQPVNVGLDVASIRRRSSATIVLDKYQTFQVIIYTSLQGCALGLVSVSGPSLPLPSTRNIPSVSQAVAVHHLLFIFAARRSAFTRHWLGDVAVCLCVSVCLSR